MSTRHNVISAVVFCSLVMSLHSQTSAPIPSGMVEPNLYFSPAGTLASKIATMQAIVDRANVLSPSVSFLVDDILVLRPDEPNVSGRYDPATHRYGLIPAIWCESNTPNPMSILKLTYHAHSLIHEVYHCQQDPPVGFPPPPSGGGTGTGLGGGSGPDFATVVLSAENSRAELETIIYQLCSVISYLENEVGAGIEFHYVIQQINDYFKESLYSLCWAVIELTRVRNLVAADPDVDPKVKYPWLLEIDRFIERLDKNSWLPTFSAKTNALANVMGI